MSSGKNTTLLFSPSSNGFANTTTNTSTNNNLSSGANQFSLNVSAYQQPA